MLLKRFGWILISMACLLCRTGMAHPMPNSAVLLDVEKAQIRAEVKLPLQELELALKTPLTLLPPRAILGKNPMLKAYILAHIRLTTIQGKPWRVQMTSLILDSIAESASGPYRELVAHLALTPPAGEPVRAFRLQYDVILEQVVNHTALVAVRQDWAAGLDGDTTVQVGTIAWDIPSNTIPPLDVNLEEGSAWKGFLGMVRLGMRHIAEGTDHMMFLLVLLLPAPLLASGQRWGGFGGVGYSLRRLIRIVTAFTLGHSITLLLGALELVRLPSQPVEVLIALSILVSAAHAVRPIFPGREAWIAGGFGLIHGLAFAGTLVGLRLEADQMALTILGFNLGIEAMQLFSIAITVPWLLLLAGRSAVYSYVRLAGSVIAAIAALGWIAERLTGQKNFIAQLLDWMQ